MSSTTRNPVRIESLAKNLFIAAYFALGATYLTCARFFQGQGFPSPSVAWLSLVGVLAFAYGVYLVIPGRAATPVEPSKNPGEIRQESLIKNVVLAIYWGLGATCMSAGWLGMLHTHPVPTPGPHYVQPAYVNNYDPRSLAILTCCGLVWLVFGTLWVLPSRFPKPVARPQAA